MLNYVRFLKLIPILFVLSACTDVVPEFKNYKATPIYVEFQESEIRVNESDSTGTVNVKINLSEALTKDVRISVNIDKNNSTAIVGSDVTFADTEFTFNPGETQKEITLNFSDDVVADNIKNLKLKLSILSGVAELGTHADFNLIIIDNESPSVKFTNAMGTVNEGDGTHLVYISIDPAPAEEVTVFMKINTPTYSSDFTFINGSIVLNPGTTTNTFTVQLIQDETFELTESFEFEIYKVTGNYQVGLDSTYTLDIEDDDPRYELSTVNKNPIVFTHPSTSTEKTVTVTNTGNGLGHEITDIVFSGENASLFEANNVDCLNSRLTISESCTVRVKMKAPGVNGDFKAKALALMTKKFSQGLDITGSSTGFPSNVLGSFNIEGISSENLTDFIPDHHLTGTISTADSTNRTIIKISSSLAAESYKVTITKSGDSSLVCEDTFLKNNPAQGTQNLILKDCFNDTRFFELNEDYIIEIIALNSNGAKKLASNTNFNFKTTDVFLVTGFITNTSESPFPGEDTLRDKYISNPDASEYFLEFTKDENADLGYRIEIINDDSGNEICNFQKAQLSASKEAIPLKTECTFDTNDKHSMHKVSITSISSVYGEFKTSVNLVFTIFANEDPVSDTLYGLSVAAINHLGNPTDQLLIGAPGDGTITTPGKIYLTSGNGNGFYTWEDTGENNFDLFGYSVADAENFDNASGDNSFIIGAPGYNNKSGNYYIYTSNSKIADGNSVNISAGSQLGHHVGSIGNIDGDSNTDLFVSAPFFSLSAANFGYNYIFDSDSNQSPQQGLQTSAILDLQSTGLGDFKGNAGPDEYAVSSYSYDSERGIVNIYEGSSSIPIKTFIGENPGDKFGYSISQIENFGPNKINAIIVSAPGYNKDQGKVYVFNINSDQTKDSMLELLGNAHTTGIVAFFNGIFANDISSAGDFNNDGYDDIAVSFNFNAKDFGGNVYVYSGLSGQKIYTLNGANFIGYGTNLRPHSLSHGNYNNDGYDDLIIGGETAKKHGKVIVIPGR